MDMDSPGLVLLESVSRCLVLWSGVVKIEKNVPMPTRRYGAMTDIARKMKKGDSVLVDCQADREALRVALRKLGAKVITRMEDGPHVRVWRAS